MTKVKKLTLNKEVLSVLEDKDTFLIQGGHSNWSTVQPCASCGPQASMEPTCPTTDKPSEPTLGCTVTATCVTNFTC